MKENKYDDIQFFNKYKQMARSIGGLEAAGEWHEFQKMMPDFQGKRVLDLGCGFGWHCRYAVEHGAKLVVGVDISERMLQVAREKTTSKKEFEKRNEPTDNKPPDTFRRLVAGFYEK